MILKMISSFLNEYSTHKKRADFAGFLVYNDKDEEIFTFGKYRNQKVKNVLEKDKGYFSWIQNADFPLYTKKVLRKIKEDMLVPKDSMTEEEKLKALQQKFNLR